MPPIFGLIAPVLLGVVFAQVALGIAAPLIALLLLGQGASSQAVGIVASAYYAGFLAGTLSADRVVISVGHARAFVVFAALGADTALLMIWSSDPWVWAMLRLVMGYQMAGLFLVAESWLNEKAAPATRGRVFGAYLLASFAGSVAGPLVLKATPGTSELFVVVGLALATALLPMALTHAANPVLGPRRSFSLRRLYAASPLGLVCCLASGLNNGAFYSLVPVFLARAGHSGTQVASFLSAVMVAALAVQYPVGMLADRFGRRPVTLVALALGAAAAVLLGLAAHERILLVSLAGCLFAGVTAPLYGLGSGQVNDYLARDEIVSAGGGLLFAWSLGAVIGPAAAGLAMSHLGAAGLPAYSCLVLGGAGGFTVLRMLRRPGVPRGLQSALTPATLAPPRLPDLAPPPAAAEPPPSAQTDPATA
jgi:MFS family permease